MTPTSPHVAGASPLRHDAAALRTDGFPAQVKLVLQMLNKLEHGALRMVLPDGQSALFGNHSAPVTITLKSWDVCDAALKSGDIGFAESYLDGAWTTDNLPALIELFVHNRTKLEAAIYGTWWGSAFYRIKHLFQRNSRRGSRKNIHAHYDIGNDFYRLWLDGSMTYSSALFSGAAGETLEQAQRNKYRRILGQLDLGEQAEVLEIGCGWGGFAELAAREKRAHVTGLTLSQEQLQFAQRRLADAGLHARADLQLRDYRDMHGQFDGIASIEMFEAVGQQYWTDYFQGIARNLKPAGRACIQTIVIADPLFQRYRKGTDFIQQYIFPGGMLPSPSAFAMEAERHGLRIVDRHAFGLDYARTLAAWRRDFNAHLDDIATQGFDQRFVRTWEFYLAYCEAGFRAGSIDVMQFTLQHAAH